MNSLFQSLRREIENLETRVHVLESFSSQFPIPVPPPSQTYAEVVRRATPIPPSSSPEPSPGVRVSPRDAAASKYSFIVLYLVIPPDVSRPKIGAIRERFARHGVGPIRNISLIGNRFAEVLVDIDNATKWKDKAKSHFEVLNDFNPLNVHHMLPAYPGASGCRALRKLHERVDHEIKSVRRPRVKDFYQNWKDRLGTQEPLSTPLHSP